jgi:hypothetical protein
LRQGLAHAVSLIIFTLSLSKGDLFYYFREAVGFFFTPLDMSYLYVYVLKSENDGNNYVGFTGDLRKRLIERFTG